MAQLTEEQKNELMERIDSDLQARQLDHELNAIKRHNLAKNVEGDDIISKFNRSLGFGKAKSLRIWDHMEAKRHNHLVDMVEKSEKDPRSDPAWRDPETGLSIDEQLAQNRAVVAEADQAGILWDIDDLNELPGYKDVAHTRLHDPTNPEHVLLKEEFEKTMMGPNEESQEDFELYHKKDRGKKIENPILVAAKHTQCIVGCVCDKDSSVRVNWFYLEEGPVQQCNCGFYYKLNRTENPNMYGEIMGYDELDMIKRDMRRTDNQMQDTLEYVGEKRMRKQIAHKVQKLPFDHPDRVYLEEEAKYGLKKAQKTQVLSLRNTIGRLIGMKQYDPEKDPDLEHMNLSVNLDDGKAKVKGLAGRPEEEIDTSKLSIEEAVQKREADESR